MPQIYLVGGVLRDKHLGIPPATDADFAVEASSYGEMKRYLIDNRAAHVWDEKPDMVSLRCKLPLRKLGDFGGYLPRAAISSDPSRAVINADFTLCRAEAMYHDNRHPSTVTPAELAVDLARRDFTVNAMAVSEDGTFYDPFNGAEDCKEQQLVAVGDAKTRFEEDPLRLLRAIRFNITKNLYMHEDIFNCLLDNKYTSMLRLLPKERIQRELRYIFPTYTVRALNVFGHYPLMANECFREWNLKTSA